jgi:hypothetical protein
VHLCEPSRSGLLASGAANVRTISVASMSEPDVVALRALPPAAALTRYARELAGSFQVPQVPERLAARLSRTVRAALTELRLGRDEERARAVAFAGCIALLVLDVQPPKLPSGRTLFEELDQLLEARGEPPVFGRGAEPVSPPRR